MRRTWIGLLVGAICIASVVGPADPAWATSGTACTSSKGAGRMCIKIMGTGLTVNDIQALFTLPDPEYLVRTTWDFELTTYTCDPRGKTKRECRPDTASRGPSRTDVPPAPGCSIVVRVGGFAGVGGVDRQLPCRSPSVGSAYASFDQLGITVPWTLGANQWVCVEISRQVNGRWIDNATANPRGDRACNDVHH